MEDEVLTRFIDFFEGEIPSPRLDRRGDSADDRFGFFVANPFSIPSFLNLPPQPSLLPLPTPPTPPPRRPPFSVPSAPPAFEQPQPQQQHQHQHQQHLLPPLVPHLSRFLNHSPSPSHSSSPSTLPFLSRPAASARQSPPSTNAFDPPSLTPHSCPSLCPASSTRPPNHQIPSSTTQIAPPPFAHAPAQTENASVLPPWNPPPLLDWATTPHFGIPDSDDFLDALVDGDFSSPSILAQSPRRPRRPSSSPSPTRTPATAAAARAAAAPGPPPSFRSTDSNPFGSAARNYPAAATRMPPARGRKRPARPSDDLSEADSASHPDAPPAHSETPPKRRRSSRTAAAVAAAAAAAAAADATSSSTSISLLASSPAPAAPAQPSSGSRRPAKRPRITATSTATSTAILSDTDDNIFVSDREDDKDIVNLEDIDELPAEEETKPKVDNAVKLGSFQCVICMDDVTDLTVTYCGHLFCSECLHSSLHVDASKKICPICRQKIDNRPASGKFTARNKGFWPLELKLMTAKKSGKLPAH